MFVLPLKPDIRQREWHVRNVPAGDIAARSGARRYDRKSLSVATQGNSIVPLYLPPNSVSVSSSSLYVPPPPVPSYLPVPPVFLYVYSFRCEPSSQDILSLSPLSSPLMA